MPTSPPTRVGIRIGFDMYRHGGGARVHNIYHFTGPDWASELQFDTVADLLVAAFKNALSAAATIKEAVGYSPGSFVPVYTKTYTQVGQLGDAANNKLCPSDCAMLLRFSTDARSSKNHPIYLFKYLKPAMNNPNTGVELIGVPSKTALETYGTALITGFDDGTQTRKLCGPRGAVALSRVVDDYIGHRDFVN